MILSINISFIRIVKSLGSDEFYSENSIIITKEKKEKKIFKWTYRVILW